MDLKKILALVLLIASSCYGQPQAQAKAQGRSFGIGGPYNGFTQSNAFASSGSSSFNNYNHGYGLSPAYGGYGGLGGGYPGYSGYGGYPGNGGYGGYNGYSGYNTGYNSYNSGYNGFNSGYGGYGGYPGYGGLYG